jgi:hypothetical protein
MKQWCRGAPVPRQEKRRREQAREKNNGKGPSREMCCGWFCKTVYGEEGENATAGEEVALYVRGGSHREHLVWSYAFVTA